MPQIVTLAMNPAIDKNVTIERVVPEHKLRCSTPGYDPGGGGINVSRAIRKLGGTSTVYYTAGDVHGRLLESLLDKEGVDHRPMRIDGRTRESFTVDETSTDQQYRFSTPGPELRAGEWKRCLQTLTGIDPKPGYLAVSGSIPPGVPDDFYARLARFAEKNDVKMILDATGKPFNEAGRAGVFLIKPNIREFRALVGKDLEDDAQQEAAARKLVEDGLSEIIVVSLGRAGALMVWKDGCEHVRAPTVSIKSKVGAGDSMVGGIVMAMVGGAEPDEAVQYGVAAGAAAVMTPGTLLCRREDTEKLFKRIKEDRRRYPCRRTKNSP